jgi:hypothetical protein
MNNPCNAPVVTRAARSTPNEVVSAATPVPAMYRASAASNSGLRPSRMVNAVRSGPPIEIPNAYAVTRNPAVLIEIRKSVATRSRMPTTTSSALPMTKVPLNSVASTTALEPRERKEIMAITVT